MILLILTSYNDIPKISLLIFLFMSKQTKSLVIIKYILSEGEL